MLTGETIGGRTLISGEKVDAFIDVGPGLISAGFSKTGQVVKTSQKGLKGYNQFLRGSKKAGVGFNGPNWQQNASKAFQTNKLNQQGLKSFDRARNIQDIATSSKTELEK